MRIFELFSGIGTQSLALKKVIKNTQISGTCDYFLPAIAAFNCLHNRTYLRRKYSNITISEKREFLKKQNLSMNSKDLLKPTYWNKKSDDFINFWFKHVKISITKYHNHLDINSIDVNKINDCDLLTYSFPCQDISLQGKGKGIAKQDETRSSLVWKVENILNHYKRKGTLPKYLLLENVVQLMYKKHIEQFKKWKAYLEALGYKNYDLVLNAVNFGSVQARKRLFMVSIKEEKLGGGGGVNVLDLAQYNKPKPLVLKDVVRVYEKDHPWFDKTFFDYKKNKNNTGFKKTRNGIIKTKLKGYTNFNSEATVYSVNGKSPTLTASGANSRIKCFFPETKKIIRICPLTAFKLMGLTEDQFNVVWKETKNYLSFEKLLYIAGNAIVMEVLIAIFKKIKQVDDMMGGK